MLRTSRLTRRPGPTFELRSAYLQMIRGYLCAGSFTNDKSLILWLSPILLARQVLIPSGSSVCWMLIPQGLSLDG